MLFDDLEYDVRIVGTWHEFIADNMEYRALGRPGVRVGKLIVG